MSREIHLPVEHVTQTAWMVAAMRLVESRRPDAHFDDNIASVLLDGREEQIFAAIKAPQNSDSSWLLTVRTYFIDRQIEELVSKGKIDTVLNLGAGLDTRPYRLSLSADLRWVEADYISTIEYKESKLKNHMPKCELTRLSAELNDVNQRLAVLDKALAGSQGTLVLTEGLLPYLPPVEVEKLARELKSKAECKYWLMDLTSWSFLNWSRKAWQMEAPESKQSGALRTSANDSNQQTTTLCFLPDDPVAVIEENGWTLETFTSFADGMIKLNRLPSGINASEVLDLEGLTTSGVGLFQNGSSVQM